MEITYLGHSCFRLKGTQGIVITDPYPPELGHDLGKPTAQIVTVSHPHPSHSYKQGVEGQPKVIAGPGEYEINNILIMGIPSFHDGENGAKRGKNTIFVLDMDDVSICHLGDLGHVLTAQQTEAIDNVDVLLLPVGGGSSLNAAMAAEVIRQLEPKVVIPMHYKTPEIKRELEPVEKFFKEWGIKEINPQPRLNISKSNLPLSTQVFWLTY